MEILTYNSRSTRLIISLIISLPSYFTLNLIQSRNVFEIQFYAYAEYTIAVFFALSILFELHHWKSELFEKRISWQESPISRLLIEIFSTLTITPLVAIGTYYLFYTYVWDMTIFFPSAIFYSTLSLFIGLLFMTFVNADYFILRWRNATLKAETLEKENVKAHLRALQNQLSPHFLFNNFNILNALMDEDIPVAKEYLHNLSEVFRYILQNKHKEVVPLKEELDFIQNYSFLLKTRFRNKFKIVQKIDAESLVLQIPPVSLQVLVENALQHNEVSAKFPLEIQLITNDQRISVSNVVKPKKGKVRSTRTGIDNIAKRYEFLTDDKLNISRTENEFIISLPLIE